MLISRCLRSATSLLAVTVFAASCGTRGRVPDVTQSNAPHQAPASTPKAHPPLTDGAVVEQASGLVTFAGGKAWIPQGQGLAVIEPDNGHTLATVLLGGTGRMTFRLGSAICVELTYRTACVDIRTRRVIHRYPEPLEAAGFGDLWGFSPDGHALIRVDPRRGVVTGRTPVEGSTDWAPLLATGDGAVWVASGTEGTLTRINPSTMQVTARVRGFGDAYSLMVVACAYGEVWVQQNANKAGVLYRIDPTSAKITGQTALGRPSEAGAYGGSDIAIADGSIWTGDSSRTVTRVQPSTMKVQKVYSLQVPPEWVSVGEGSIWTSFEDDAGNGATERLAE